MTEVGLAHGLPIVTKNESAPPTAYEWTLLSYRTKTKRVVVEASLTSVVLMESVLVDASNVNML